MSLEIYALVYWEYSQRLVFMCQESRCGDISVEKQNVNNYGLQSCIQKSILKGCTG